MEDNLTIHNLVGLMCVVMLLLVIVVLFFIVWFFSCVLVHSRNRARLTIAVQSAANSPGGTAPQDGVVFGIDEAALDSCCPTMIYSHKSCNSLKSGNSDQEAEDMKSCCSICLSDYNENEVVRMIPDCGHMFHKVCIDQWLGNHATCPICRISPHYLPTSLPQRTLATPTPTSSPIPGVTHQV